MKGLLYICAGGNVITACLAVALRQQYDRAAYYMGFACLFVLLIVLREVRDHE